MGEDSFSSAPLPTFPANVTACSSRLSPAPPPINSLAFPMIASPAPKGSSKEDHHLLLLIFLNVLVNL
jgi:hypothetical protein